MKGPSFQYRHLAITKCILTALALCATQLAFASPITVSVNTSGLSGQAGILAFDLIDSSSAASSLAINNFTGDYTLDDSPALTGDASGNTASGFALADGQFFNEVAIPVVLGNSLGFDLDFAFGAPGTTDFPDELSIFLLTSDFSASLISTDDPTGADSILDYFVDATGAANLTTYNATDASSVTVSITTQTIPEPTPLGLMIVPLMSLLMSRRKTN